MSLSSHVNRVRFVLLVVPALVFAPSAYAVPPKSVAAKMLVPLATHRIPAWIPSENYVQKIVAATSRQIILQIGNRRQPSFARIVFVDRRTASAQNDFSSQGVYFRQQSLSSFWQVLGSVETGRDEPVVVLQQYLQSTALPGVPPTQFGIYGFGSTGYPPRWSYPATSAAPANEKIVGITVAGGLLLLRSEDARISLWDARTGTPIDRATPAGTARIQQAVRAAGTPLVQLEQGRLYRLDTGVRLPPVYEPVGDQSITPSGATTDRALWTFSGDTGFMGSGSRPNYLIATDGQGKKVWQFPDPLVDPSSGMYGSAKNAEDARRLFRSVENVTLVDRPGDKSVAIVEASGYLYGLRVRDGKMLWSQPQAKIFTLLPAVGKAGLFVLRVAYDPRTGTRQSLRLESFDPLSGAKRKTWPFTDPAVWMGAAGDNLITVDAQGNVRIYQPPK